MGEHSVELALVWLQATLARNGGGAQPVIVPVLCGATDDDTAGRNDPAYGALVSGLRRLLAGGDTFVVAAGDLSHVGPAFGDPRPLDAAALKALEAADRRSLDEVANGDAGGFYRDVVHGGDERRVCGLAPILVALDAVAPSRGALSDYAQCAADPEGASWVSVAGVTLHAA